MEQVTNVTKLEVVQGIDDQYYWHGKSANGEIVTTSEAFTRKYDAKVAAMAVFPELEVHDGTASEEADQDQESEPGQAEESGGSEEGAEDPGEQAAGDEEEQEPDDAEAS